MHGAWRIVCACVGAGNCGVQAVRVDIKAVFWTRDEGDKLWGRQEGGGGTDGIVELRHSPNH